ncbi:biliverdin-producing heme oxygenase [Agrobacterium vitis]|uniref:Biliverdin-producing heme oxygenase n=1 Tax=Agrobacterium vitis TaxID=373 RepID=A0AAE2RFP8_AGRVI|nr:biliverdin-producing heme oxygenase [Agrobacterium vitis]MBF2717685.1 biliverdin-producing heme oxygenase [Agrobacterium vitis]MVA22626.1 biliverdin-producing heme oxygenase [Agrobacterium vitis]
MSTFDTMENTLTREASRTKRLKAATYDAHERLDQFIMKANPFADREHYGRFLAMQFHFHHDLDGLFFDPDLDLLLPDLGGRRRIEMIGQDFADLGLELPSARHATRFRKGETVDLPEALGWLYVIEGSNLGAAFLLKYAAQLGLNENFGARHLAGATEGRGLHWRTFTAALDSIALTDEQERKAIVEAETAFEHVHTIAREMFS